MGENFFGLAVTVGTDAYASAGNVCAGMLVDGRSGVEVDCPAQAVTKIQTTKARIALRLIARSISRNN
jgi:hypothetical protein